MDAASVWAYLLALTAANRDFLLAAMPVSVLNAYVLIYFDDKRHGVPHQRRKMRLLVSLILCALLAALFSCWYLPQTMELPDVLARVFLATTLTAGAALLLSRGPALRRKPTRTLVKASAPELQPTSRQLVANNEPVEPSVLFPVLSTLSALMTQEPHRARELNDRLAGVYRYVLENRHRKLVSVQDEVNFIQNYVAVLRLSHPQALVFTLAIDLPAVTTWCIPPNFLQALLDFAMKHNPFSREQPLHLEVFVRKGVAGVQYPFKKVSIAPSDTANSLATLAARYRLLTNRKIESQQVGNFYRIKLPLVYGS